MAEPSETVDVVRVLGTAVAGLLLVVVAMWWFGKSRPTNKKTNKKSPAPEAAPKPLAAIPGLDPSDPNLGNMAEIGKAGSLHELLMQLHARHGEIVRFWWMKDQVVSIASPAAFKDTRRLADRPPSLFALLEPLIGKQSMQFANGEDFAQRRTTYRDRPFSHAGLRHVFWTFESVIEKRMAHWNETAGSPLNLQAEMFAVSMRIIALSALGSSLDSDEEIGRIVAAYNACWHDMEARMGGSFPEPGSERERLFNDAVRTMRSKAREVAQAKRLDQQQQQKKKNEKNEKSAANNASKNDDKGGEGAPAYTAVIDYLLDSNLVSEEQLMDEIVTFLVGGFHTTGNMLTWAVYYIISHDRVLQRVKDEVRAVLGDRRMPTFDDLAQFVYLNQCLSETLRLSALGPFAARFSDEEVTVRGFAIPPHTAIVHALGVVLHDPKLWPEPRVFDPDRFERAAVKEREPLAFEPFGFAGKRACPGSRLSSYEGVAVLAALFRSFEVRMVDPDQPVTPVHGLVTFPKEDIMIALTPV